MENVSGFSISHPLIKLTIRLEKIERLHPHEEAVPEFLDKLKKQIEADGCIKHPVTVDEKSLVVLDGNHRFLVAKGLECRFIPVCLVNYENLHLLLDCWYRVVKPFDIERLISSIKELKLKVESCEFDEACKLVGNREAITAIASQTCTHVVYGSHTNVREIYQTVKQIENKLKSKDFTVSYEIPANAQKKISSKEALVMMVPVVLKKEVREETLKGNIFPPKSTRHILPGSPLFVNASLDWLRGKLTCEEANKVFARSLSSRQLSLVPKEGGGEFVFK